MTAAEIRKEYQGKHPAYDPVFEHQVHRAKIEVLAEIAAQLAELNARLADPSGVPVALCRTNDTIPIAITERTV